MSSPALQAYARGWCPPDRRPLRERVRDVVLPSNGVWDPPGPFVPSPYHLEPLNAVDDDSVRFVTIQKGVQLGGSVLGDVILYDGITHKPQNIFVNGPTDEWAKNWAKRRLMKLFHAPGPVADRIQGVREQNRHNATTTEILFGDMFIAVQGANESNLQSFPVPFIYNEELWEWAPSMYQHAVARTDHYEWRSKILNISQAGDVNSDQDQALKSGSMEVWDVPCLHCNRFHNMPWNVRIGDHNATGKKTYAGIIWDSNERTRRAGVWDWQALAPTCRIVCPHCLAATPDEMALRQKMSDLGRYRATNPNAPKNNRSFQLPKWANPTNTLAATVERFLRAKDQEKVGNLVPIQEWWQKDAALSYDPAEHRSYEIAPAVELGSTGDPPVQGGDPPPLRKHWEKQDFLCGVFDIQSDHCWGMVVAWSKTGEDMILWFGGGAEPERTRTEPLWDDRDIAAIQERFGIEPQCMFLDCRHDPGRVYKWCASHFKEVTTRHGRKATVCWNAVQGAGTQHFTYTIPATKTRPARNMRLPYSWPPVKIDPCTRLRPGEDATRELLRGKLINRINFAKPWIDPIAFERREMLLRGEVSFMKKADWNDELSKQLQGEQPQVVQPKFGQATTKSKYVGANHGLDLYRISIMFACIVEIIGDKRSGE